MERKETMKSKDRFFKGSLVASDLHKEYGGVVVLDRVSLSINPEDKIGFVGQNGCGKSTLLKILYGAEIPNRGIVKRENIRIGYLPQDYHLEGERTIYDIATEGVAEIIKALEEYERMNLEYRARDNGFIRRYEELLDYLQSNNGFELSDRIKSTLSHLGISYPPNTKIKELSGGETVRLALARLLIADPNILLLDEPTNNLDIEANLWLRRLLSSWSGSLLVVSHDRDFLDDVTTSTLELENGRVKVYGGNYAFYKQQKGIEAKAQEREIIRLEKEAQKAQRAIEKEKERTAHSARRGLKPKDSDKFGAGFRQDKATRTSGKRNEQTMQRIDTLAEQLQASRIRAQRVILPTIKTAEGYKGKVLIRAREIKCRYDNRLVIKEGSIQINYGDRVAIFGKNGAGKTTLINGLLGIEGVVTEGEVSIAENIEIQVLDQRYSIVDRQKTVLENFLSVTSAVPIKEVRNYLARFLFARTPEVNKKAVVLSGGELARLAVAMVAAMPVDLLVLDEPTNNLDIESIEQFESALQEFKGAILIISHDLSFLEELGVSNSYVISQGRVIKLINNPKDGDDFQGELLASL